nr:TetR-like C-terminal domain-containing protein [Actinomadura pelletieri]
MAEGVRNEALARATLVDIGVPRRARGEAVFRRAVERGEPATDIDMGMALDLVIALIFWRLNGLHGASEPDYLDRVATVILRALSPN